MVFLSRHIVRHCGLKLGTKCTEVMISTIVANLCCPLAPRCTHTPVLAGPVPRQTGSLLPVDLVHNPFATYKIVFHVLLSLSSPGAYGVYVFVIRHGGVNFTIKRANVRTLHIVTILAEPLHTSGLRVDPNIRGVTNVGYQQAAALARWKSEHTHCTLFRILSRLASHLHFLNRWCVLDIRLSFYHFLGVLSPVLHFSLEDEVRVATDVIVAPITM
mmetsp:Transcript_9130/g.13752  ORF Transcript_9130/g.13752 Transcript_9130/m.13752 type:complete len:216 (-) Transcript_9130:3441-4088(-)